MRISVAMATYNGGRFLSEQLESLARQSDLPCELVICDDGSTDETLQVLDRFADHAPFPVRVFHNERNLGFADNFLRAASLCEGEAIAFCDQDDVWLPNKLADTVAAFARDSATVLVLQIAFLCTADLSHKGRLFPGRLRPGFHAPGTQYGFWVWPGFLQTVRSDYLQAAAGLVRPRSYFPGHETMPHDKLTCIIANASGGVSVLPVPAALYRRHDAAVTGFYAAQSMAERVGKALSVGAAHYTFLSEVATETASFLDALAERVAAMSASDFMVAAERFRQLSRVQALRAELYSAISPVCRLQLLFEIALRGGYVGPRMLALGGKSAAKDILVAIGFSSQLKKSAE